VASNARRPLSGGLDSYTAAALRSATASTLFALSINYGQRHSQELEAARTVARALGVERHLETRLDLTRSADRR
jgi:7-cyano-7-deazaguanine synthase